MTDNVEKKRILIVDDMDEHLIVLKEILKDDYIILSATHGKEALKISQSDNPPDLILLDIMMPEMDGYEICRRLKADENTRNIPVIFVTAMQKVEDETRGFEVGAVDYIRKPLSPPMVRARVNTHLKIKGLISDLEQALSKVKTLSGLLPICPSCKNIRDDKGYWNRIEAYFQKHSEARFSHCFCPECAQKLYPDLYTDVDE